MPVAGFLAQLVAGGGIVGQRLRRVAGIGEQAGEVEATLHLGDIGATHAPTQRQRALEQQLGTAALPGGAPAVAQLRVEGGGLGRELRLLAARAAERGLHQPDARARPTQPLQHFTALRQRFELEAGRDAAGGVDDRRLLVQ